MLETVPFGLIFWKLLHKANVILCLFWTKRTAIWGITNLTILFHYLTKHRFFAEPGGILIVEKGYNDYSFSEISQIVESNNTKLLGAFISKTENDVVQITIKIGSSGLNDIIQTFRRYSYNIISGREEDTFMQDLKERSDYLNKYLNL